jgi:hypothetical protein
MEIPLTPVSAELLFVGVLVLIVLAFVVEVTFDIALEQWMQKPKPRPERPRFPWTDRNGT